jgi:putative transposase
MKVIERSWVPPRGMKEDRESGKNFFVWLKERGLKGIRLIIGDK